MSAHKPKKKTLLESSLELAKLMHKDPSGIERDIYQAGENLVGIFSDANFSTRRFKNLNEQKLELLKNALDDVSSGVQILRSSIMGLVQKNNDVTPYVSPHGSPPDGTIIFSVNWKNVAAFKNWRKTDEDPVTQDDINNSIYFLTVEISRLMK